MVTAHHKPRRRVSGGRAKRLANQSMKTSNEAVRGGLLGGCYSPLSKIDMDNINIAALTVLEKTGISDHFEELLDLILPKGAFLNSHGRLCFPRSLIEDILANSAKEFYVYARGERAGKDDSTVLPKVFILQILELR